MTEEDVDFLRENERTAVFIDGANLYSSTTNMQVRIDYKRLRELFEFNTDLRRIYYYTAVTDGTEFDPLHKLVDYLSYNGYTTVTKQVKEFPSRDGTGFFRKGNMDVDIAVDILRMAPQLDHIILMSGDGDFRAVVQEVQRNCRVTVISTPDVTAAELRKQCDHYVNLHDLSSLFLTRRELQAAG